MGFLNDVVAWFLDPEQWSGNDGIPARVAEHLQISASAILVAAAIALPVGLFIGHFRRGTALAVGLANAGRAIPSYALLAILFAPSIVLTRGTAIDFRFLPTFLAMTALAIPPILTNAYVGVREVDTETVEAARGMGMRGREVLRHVELPLALPVILAGLRTASVQVVATAALGAVIGGGGLGRYIVQGIARHDDIRLFAGAAMVALIALVAELAFALLQRAAVSPGLRAGARAVPRRRTLSDGPQLDPADAR